MEKKMILQIDPSFSGRKIKSLAEHELNLSATLIKRIKALPGAVKLNGENARLEDRVKEGDCLLITIPVKINDNIEKKNIPLNILYEDEDIVLINKPGNMPTHPSEKHKDDTLINALNYYYDGKISLHVITRLDRETSGVVLVCKNPPSAKILTMDMVNKKIKKEYVALLNGVPQGNKGVINASIKRKDEKGILREVAKEGKEAVTEYEVIKEKDGFSFVRLCPLTGRTHQLRVHMKYISTPIYADYLYGERVEGERVQLHCKKLTFTHPFNGKNLVIEADLPFDMKNNIVAKIGIL